MNESLALRRLIRSLITEVETETDPRVARQLLSPEEVEDEKSGKASGADRDEDPRRRDGILRGDGTREKPEDSKKDLKREFSGGGVAGAMAGGSFGMQTKQRRKK